MDQALRFCPRCGLDRPLGAFGVRRESGRPTAWCRECKTRYDGDSYQRNGAVRRAAAAARNAGVRARNRRLLEAAKNVPCMDCGERYPPFVMDLDHVRGDKQDNVSLMAGTGASEAAIMEEIAKCDVVCANCHRERTHGGRPRPASAPTEGTAHRPGHQLRLFFEGDVAGLLAG